MSTCDRYEVPIGEEAAYLESITPVPCNETFEGCIEEREDEPIMGLDSTGTGPGQYNAYPHTCDWHLPNWVRIISGSHQNAGTGADIWMCFGRHMENYNAYSPLEYDRPETLWYDDTPEGQDAACINLGQGPSAPNTVVYYHFCSLDTWYDFFSWLEPDDWDFIRFWMPSTNGLQIVSLAIYYNGQTIYNDGMNYWLDKYYNRQLFMDWRIAQYKHDRMAAIVGKDYMLSILELAAQDIGFSGARKYNKDDGAWCSEFAVYAIQQATKLSSLCPNPPRPLVTGDIQVDEMYDWFYGCSGGSRVIPNIRNNSHLMKPGYYLSVNGQGHSVIFVDWVGAVDGDFYVIDGNSNEDNTVCLYNRGDWYDNVLGTDFAGRTY